MMMLENLSEAEVELNGLLAGPQGSLEQVGSHSRPRLVDVEKATPESSGGNPPSIHHRPGTDNQKPKFGELMEAELIIRKMSPLGTHAVKLEVTALL
jgi:hypothetical protein